MALLAAVLGQIRGARVLAPFLPCPAVPSGPSYMAGVRSAFHVARACAQRAPRPMRMTAGHGCNRGRRGGGRRRRRCAGGRMRRRRRRARRLSSLGIGLGRVAAFVVVCGRPGGCGERRLGVGHLLPLAGRYVTSTRSPAVTHVAHGRRGAWGLGQDIPAPGPAGQRAGRGRWWCASQRPPASPTSWSRSF